MKSSLRLLPVLALMCFATQADALDFKEAYEQVLSNNGEYRAQVSRLKAAKADVWAARSQLLPQISLSGNVGVSDENRQTLVGTSGLSVNDVGEPLPINSRTFAGNELPFGDTFNNGDATLSIEQVLFDLSTWYAAKEASSEQKASYYQFLRLREGLILELVTTYTNYLDARQRKLITESELKALANHKTLTQRRQDDGLGTATDVNEADSRYQLVYADFLQTDFEVNQALRQLDVLLGSRVEAATGLQPDFSIRLLDEPDFNNVEFTDTHDTLLAKQDVKSAQFRSKQSSSKFLPTLRLTGRSRYLDQEESLFQPEDRRLTNSVMLELQVPLFASFGNVSRKKSDRLELEARKALEENSMEQARSEFEISQLNFRSSYERLKALEAAFRASKAALKLREKGFLEGLSSNLDLLDALRDTFRTERLYQTGIYEYFRQYYQFAASYREINDDDIDFLNNFLMKEN